MSDVVASIKDELGRWIDRVAQVRVEAVQLERLMALQPAQEGRLAEDVTGRPRPPLAGRVLHEGAVSQLSERSPNLVLGVHHERPVGNDRFANRSAGD